MAVSSLVRLLIIMPTRSRGGVEAHGLAICRAAVREGSGIETVEVAFPNLSTTQGLIAAVKRLGANYLPLPIAETEIGAAATLSELVKTLPLRLLAWIEKPYQFTCAIACIMRWRSRAQMPTIVLVNLPWADKGITSLLACALLNQPAVVVFHLIPWRLEIPRWKRWLYRWMRDRHQTWIAISENNRQLASESFGCSKEEIVRIYNGPSIVRSAIDTRTASRQRLCHELSISQESILVLTVARLNSQKGHDTLIPTIPHIVRQFPNVHFVWVGEGEQKDALVRQLNDYDSGASVSLLGYREDISHLLKSADLFVFPTHYEGFPFALLEAMAIGVPVVATGVNGIPEIVEHAVEGLLVREGDSCDLLETLRWALTHPEKMRKMRDRAAMKVQRFSEEKMTAETLKLLLEMNHG